MKIHASVRRRCIKGINDVEDIEIGTAVIGAGWRIEKGLVDGADLGLQVGVDDGGERKPHVGKKFFHVHAHERIRHEDEFFGERSAAG